MANSFSVLNLQDSSISFFAAKIDSEVDRISQVFLYGANFSWESFAGDTFTEIEKKDGQRYLRTRLFCKNPRDIDPTSYPLELRLVLIDQRPLPSETVSVIAFR